MVLEWVVRLVPEVLVVPLAPLVRLGPLLEFVELLPLVAPGREGVEPVEPVEVFGRLALPVLAGLEGRRLAAAPPDDPALDAPADLVAVAMMYTTSLGILG